MLTERNSSIPVALLVEDHPMNRKLLRDVLQIRFDVVDAGSAEEAGELLAQYKPDVIFLDMRLPGMDGLTFARWLKEDPATDKIPIVAVSAHNLPEEIEEALAAGCLEYITKPITEDPLELVERMAELVDSSNQQ